MMSNLAPTGLYKRHGLRCTLGPWTDCTPLVCITVFDPRQASREHYSRRWPGMHDTSDRNCYQLPVA